MAGALPQSSDVTVNGGTLDVSAAAQTINSLTMTGGALNLNATNLLTVTNAGIFAGTLNLSGVTGTGEIVAYGSYGGGTFTTVTGLPSGDTLAYNPTELDIVVGVVPISYVWSMGVSGYWSGSTNYWTPGVPNADGAGAVINQATSNPVTVTLNIPATIGTLLLGNSGNATTGYTLSGSGGNTLTFSNTSNNAPAANFGHRRYARHRCAGGFGLELGGDVNQFDSLDAQLRHGQQYHG